VREGRPEAVLPALAAETGAEAIHFASDVSPFAMARDRRVEAATGDVAVRRHPGNFVADVGAPRTADGRPYSVFSPFWRRWEELPRREVHGAPRALRVPGGVAAGAIPRAEPEAGDPFPPGEAAARERLRRWLDGPVDAYRERHDRLAGGTSQLSPYLHFGCVSARRARAASARARRPGSGGRSSASSRGATSTRQCCSTIPATRATRTSATSTGSSGTTIRSCSTPWREGRTGYPVVDAAMRQLRARGWMHNRGRLIAGCS
jgi:deoxyribodipyrimidine photo-lyase